VAIHRLFAPVLALLLLGPACGGGSSGGNRNSSTGFLAITAPSDVIKCGDCQPLSATYTKGGTSQAVTPTWSTDNPNIATIDSTGRLTPLAHGDVNVTARYEGASASKLIHVVNDYGTTWVGQYVITRCDASSGPAWEGFCDPEAFFVSRALQIALEFQQERYAVTGTVWLGSVQSTFTGTVNTGGELTGESKGSMSSEDGVVDLLVSPFRVVQQGERIADGSFTVTMTASWAAGRGAFDARVMGLDKYTGGRTAIRKAPWPPRTLSDVWQMMRQR
jgi:hypothetical protein